MMKTVFAALATMAFLLTPLSHTAEAVSVAGKWHFVLDTPGGDRELDSVFAQDMEKVSGKWGVDSNGKAEANEVAGTYADKKLLLSFPMESPEVGPGTMKIKGQLANDGSLSGDWAFQDYAGTFKATRVKDETPKKEEAPKQ